MRSPGKVAHPPGLQSAHMVMKVLGERIPPLGELLSLRDIERLHKKPKSDKETRLATAMKNFMMMRYSHNVRSKNKRSFREKQ
ncbi:hypothetical protein HPG69_001380, partial [Diceros bicornis minor]